ncbi:MAG: peptidase associated/transthyretin-like domain-containing protein [Armatimonadota bacterium]
MMSKRTYAWYALSLALTALLAFVLAGCSTSPGGYTSGGTGADGGPWPTAPNRQQANTPARPSDAPPPANLVVLLQGKSAKDQELQLNIDRIELKYEDKVQLVTTGVEIAKQEKLPLRFGEKGTTILLVKTQVPRRKYSHIQLRLADEKTSFVAGEQTQHLTLASSAFELGDWTPDEKKPNVITISLDGTKVATKGDSATLPTTGISVKTSIPKGGISGKLIPPATAGRVDIYWGTGKTLIGSAVPSPQDGTFTIENLPSGSYSVDIHVPGQRLIDPLTKPVNVEEKVLALPKLELTAETTNQ